MSRFLKTAFIGPAALLILGIAPASSAQANLTQNSLEIRNFIGSIDWSNDALSVEITKNAGKTKISGRNAIIVDGGQNDIDGSDCKSTYGRFDFDWFGKKKDGHFGGYKGMKDLPVLNITLPKNTKLILRDSIIFTDGSPDISEAEIDLRYCGKVTLGDIDGTLALDSRGSADIAVGKTGQIAANLKGSGDLTGGDSTDVLIKSNGSADVELEDITSLEMSVNGSGDVSVGHIDGDVTLDSNGSGDIDIGQIDGSLSYSGKGSGDLDIMSIDGVYLELSSYGSGDIEIGGGRVEEMTAATRGSGDIEFSGHAKTAKLRASGSGDISVERVTSVAETKSSGSGDVDINERG